MKIAIKLLLLALAFVALPFKASADLPGDHPGYIHALSDLRTARFLLTREHVGARDHFAIESIDRAINEIKNASIDDGKDLNDHPPVDASLNDSGRFHKALELLEKAHQDIAQDEDNVFAQGLQHRALEHIDKAHHVVKEILESW
jgi:hypothetical protein